MSELLPCPFCGCAMSVRSNRDWHRLIGDHDDDCVFLEEESMVVPAQDHHLKTMIADWNRRAPAQQPAAAPVSGDVVRGDVVLDDVKSIISGIREFYLGMIASSVRNDCADVFDKARTADATYVAYRAVQDRFAALFSAHSPAAAAPVSGDVALPEPVGMFAPAGESGDKFPVWHRVQVLAAARTYGQQCSDAALERAAKAIDEFADKHLTGDDLKCALALIDVVRALKGGDHV